MLKGKKAKVGIIGTGNIGTDLLFKIQRSELLECSIFAGKNLNSEGIKRAKNLGINTSFESINAIIAHPELCDIVFDATSAEAHRVHAPILNKLGKFTIDMTPSRIGKMCVPYLNLEDCLSEANVNMVTCGGQATAPIIRTIEDVEGNLNYVEIVASISSKSAGVGTRNNIDEYTKTTSEAIKQFAGVKNAKAIIVLNPAEPPILMHNTIFVPLKKAKLSKLWTQLIELEKKIKKYVPGYKITNRPVIENNRLIIMNQVIGRGDFLPSYAGNLDIINCAAIEVAEAYTRKYLIH
ncbi:acetaldehyde dehydrogenase (acetylating) [Candidatus Curtissbacteria bacterium]|nr:acetaldehyde dehydrogenase (acetylating) [Candidatus Curtissbacteria bacterium]